MSAAESLAALTTSEAVLGVEESLGGRRWNWHAGASALSEAHIQGLAQRYELPDVLARLLAMRGVPLEEAMRFLAPTLRALLPDPSCFQDMDRAAERLADAAVAGATVGIFGDYDVDGACATALLAHLLRGLGCIVHTHIPDRVTEGYGPNLPALEALAEKGCGLIVCVDCGTAAGDILAGMADRADIIVLDHHKAEGPPPPVLATVNPNRLDCASGHGQLCATAVTFIAGVATLRVLRKRAFFAATAEPDLMALLDLVALATVCDVMPLTGLNRALVGQGLRVMGRNARTGIAALLEVAQARGLPTAMTCGFALGPRINAGGRIADSGLGLRLLLTEDAGEAREIAEMLDGINRQRQQIEGQVLDQAMALAAAQVAAGRAVLLVHGPDWHAGVVGIVAGRLKERFNRPACVLALADGRATGSGRSVPGLDLGAAILSARQRGLLERGGGHAMAAGFALPEEGIPALHDFLDETLSVATALPRAPALAIEGSLTVQAATKETAEHLGRLAPFGTGNEEPLLVLPYARVSRAERVGKDGSTVRAFLSGEGGGRLKAVLFRAKTGALAEALLDPGGRPLHIAGHLRAESWNGIVSANFQVVDAAWA